MRILINLFFLSKIGGVLTFHKQLVNGFNKIDHDVVSAYISKNKTNVNREKVIQRYGVDEVFGYETSEMLSHYEEFIKEYDPDLVIFSHPSPTMTSKYTTRDWQKIFNISGERCYLVFHEPIDNRRWIGEVKNNIIGLGAVQEKAIIGIENIKEFNNINYKIIDFPMSFEDSGLYTNIKERCCISTHHMKSWKHVDIQIRAIPHIDYPMFVTGRETEYYYMSGSIEKRKKIYREDGKWIWDTALESGKLKYLGIISRDSLNDLFKTAMCSVDMSTGERGTELARKFEKENKLMKGGNLMRYLGEPKNKVKKYTSLNYGVFSECCKYGVFPIMRSKWSKIKLLERWEKERDYTCASWIPEKNLLKSLVDTINFTIGHFNDPVMEEMRTNNLELAKRDLDCGVVANNILKHVKELI